MNSSFPNRWSFSYLKFTKYVTYIIAEPKYKYGQQEQVTVRKHKLLPFLASSGRLFQFLQNDYKCLRIWQQQNMATFKDFLIWYNNLDVGHFFMTVERWQQQYFDEDLDVYKTTISLPGLTRQMLYSYSRQTNAQFSLTDQKNADLHQELTQNLFGGPSVIRGSGRV